MNASRFVLVAVLLVQAIPATAQDLPMMIRLQAACAPVGTVADSDAPRVSAIQPTERLMFNAGERVAIEPGAWSLDVGQRFFVRRRMNFPGAPRAEHTIGWLTITQSTLEGAVATIDFACDAVRAGDRLEPYVEPKLPPYVDRTDATGTLDRSGGGRVLYGVDGKQLGGGRDFTLANRGRRDGISTGARYAVFHRRLVGHEADRPFAEAVVVSVFPDMSLLRITAAAEAVTEGDRLVMRVGGRGFADDQQILVPRGEGAPAPVDEPHPAVEIRTPHQDIAFEEVYFDFDRIVLKPEALTLLDKAVVELKADPTLRVQIEGHTCNIGPAAYNLALGEKRAKAVRDYLVEHGVPATQLTTVSYGEDHPKYDNSKKDTRRLNRRAAFVVDPPR